MFKLCLQLIFQHNAFMKAGEPYLNVLIINFFDIFHNNYKYLIHDIKYISRDNRKLYKNAMAHQYVF